MNQVQMNGEGDPSQPEKFEGSENRFQGAKPNDDPGEPAVWKNLGIPPFSLILESRRAGQQVSQHAATIS